MAVPTIPTIPNKWDAIGKIWTLPKRTWGLQYIIATQIKASLPTQLSGVQSALNIPDINKGLIPVKGASVMISYPTPGAWLWERREEKTYFKKTDKYGIFVPDATFGWLVAVKVRVKHPKVDFDGNGVGNWSRWKESTYGGGDTIFKFTGTINASACSSKMTPTIPPSPILTTPISYDAVADVPLVGKIDVPSPPGLPATLGDAINVGELTKPIDQWKRGSRVGVKVKNITNACGVAIPELKLPNFAVSDALLSELEVGAIIEPFIKRICAKVESISSMPSLQNLIAGESFNVSITNPDNAERVNILFDNKQVFTKKVGGVKTISITPTSSEILTLRTLAGARKIHTLKAEVWQKKPALCDGKKVIQTSHGTISSGLVSMAEVITTAVRKIKKCISSVELIIPETLAAGMNFNVTAIATAKLNGEEFVIKNADTTLIIDGVPIKTKRTGGKGRAKITDIKLDEGTHKICVRVAPTEGCPKVAEACETRYVNPILTPEILEKVKEERGAAIAEVIKTQKALAKLRTLPSEAQLIEKIRKGEI